MIDYEKTVRDYCKENDITASLSYDMPAGYETANGMFDVVINTIFIHKAALCVLPEYEQLFYLFHELRHASQYLHPEQFSSAINRSRFYVIMFDGVCHKLIGNKWSECRLDGGEEYFSDIYLGQPYEADANQYAYESVKRLLGDSPELDELYAFWTPKRNIPVKEYEDLYSEIDAVLEKRK